MKKKLSLICLLLLLLITGCDNSNNILIQETSDIESQMIETTKVEKSSEFIILQQEEYDSYKIDVYTADLLVLNINVVFSNNSINENVDNMTKIMDTIMIDYIDKYDKLSFIFGQTDAAIAMIDFKLDNGSWKKDFVVWSDKNYEHYFN